MNVPAQLMICGPPPNCGNAVEDTSKMGEIVLNNLFKTLSRMRAANIHFSLSQVREEAIMVHVSVPGERWEVEFMIDGSVEVERFVSDGSIGSASILNDLFSRFSDLTDDDRRRGQGQ